MLEEVSVELGPALNVFTGETGAGKSLVVDSLALLCGARATSELIRTGAETLRVTGVFTHEGAADQVAPWLAVLERVRFEEDLGPFVRGVIDASRTTVRTDGYSGYLGLEAAGALDLASTSHSASDIRTRAL